MTRTTNALIHLTIATIVGGSALLWNGNVPSNPGQTLISFADARIGRPLTPLSYAGVARRTTRRAVGAGAYGGAVYVAPVVVAPSCVQVADAYGRIYSRCY